jgi:hypothetical protein
MADFNYTMCHNLRPFKVNVTMDGQDQCLNDNRNSPKIPHNDTWWILVLLSGTITLLEFNGMSISNI